MQKGPRRALCRGLGLAAALLAASTTSGATPLKNLAEDHAVYRIRCCRGEYRG